MIPYRIGVGEAHAHLFDVSVQIAEPAQDQPVSLPVWIPGSYLVREFARHLSALEARQDGQPVRVEPLDKSSWRLHCRAGVPLTLRYRVYAFDTSVRAAYLDAERGFFNGTSLCLRVHGQEAQAHTLELVDLPAGWQVATSMAPAPGGGPRSFRAADYDELVDHPFELGRFWRGEFVAAGVPHSFVVAGALPDFDGERLLADTKRICETQIAFWHGADGGAKPPFDRYVFLLNTVEDGHGGLEHRASTALLASRRDLPRRTAAGGEPGELSDGNVSLLGLVSHEYFHTWNVKRLRPKDFARYDYDRENYTELLWFFEGFTSYYDDVLLLRSGLVDPARYLKLVAKALSSVLATPGRQAHSVAQASFDAWVKFYRGDENTPNATISYYAKGALVALAFDLTLRREGRGGTLDDVMRALWQSSGGGPVDEADIARAFEQVGGRSFAPEFAAWVHGTDELPLAPLLASFGVDWQAQTATLAQRLALRVAESPLTGIKVSHVLRGGAAERAGLAAGDELLALADWRLRRLEDGLRLLADDTPTPLLVARDQRLLRLTLTLPAAAPAGSAGAPGAVALAPADAAAAAPAALALRKAWLGG